MSIEQTTHAPLRRDALHGLPKNSGEPPSIEVRGTRSSESSSLLTRRQMLRRMCAGFGMLGLSGLLGPQAVFGASPLPAPHFKPRAKRIIFLFMNGGPSHVDTFDPKPALATHAGKPVPDSIAKKVNRNRGGKLMPSPFQFAQHGKSGIPVAEIYPELAPCVDDLCILRSLWTDNPNHEPGLLMMNSGNMQPIRPSLGSWLTYALGSDNQNLPGFVVLCPGKPVVGPQLWSNSFLPGIYQGTHINNKTIDPRTIIRDVRNPYLA